MRVLFDFSVASDGFGGPLTAMKGLLDGWSQAFPSDSITAFGSADLGPARDGVEWLTPAVKLRPQRLFQQQIELPLRHSRVIGSSDVVISGHLRPLLPVSAQIIGMLHDVRHLRQPQDFRKSVNLYRRWMWWASAKRLAGVVAVSDFSLREATALGMPLPRHVCVAPLGSDHVERRSEAVKQNLVLYVAHRGSKLDPDLAVLWKQVEARIERPVPQLTISGVSDKRQRSLIIERFRDAGLVSRPRFLEYVPRREFEELLASAKAVLYLSNYEGFGLVPSEATMLGTMSFVYDLPPYRERRNELHISTAPLGEPANLGRQLAEYLASARSQEPTAAIAQTRWRDTAATYRELASRVLREGSK